MRKIMKDLGLKYFVVSETKLDESFSSQQLVIDFEIRAKKDRDWHGGGIIENVRKGFICTRPNYLEPKSPECICSELTLFNKKWICYGIYRPPSSQNLDAFNN